MKAAFYFFTRSRPRPREHASSSIIERLSFHGKYEKQTLNISSDSFRRKNFSSEISRSWKRNEFLDHWRSDDSERKKTRDVARGGRLKPLDLTIFFRTRELCRFDSFLRDVVYLRRNGNLTRNGNIPVDGVLHARIPSRKEEQSCCHRSWQFVIHRLGGGHESREEKRHGEGIRDLETIDE